MTKYDIVFSLADCNNIKYYIPLVDHAKKRGFSCSFDIVKGWNKWCSISVQKNLDWTLNLISQRDIPLFVRGVDTAKVRVCNEGRWNPSVRETNTTIYSLTSLVDYTFSYFDYIEKIDFCVFPSPYFVEFIKNDDKIILGTGGEGTKKIVNKTLRAIEKNVKKNIFLGSPKYDCLETFNDKRIYEKYGLNSKEKYALFMYPRSKDVKKTKYKDVLLNLKKEGYTIISKTRLKDPFFEKESLIDFYFYDSGFWPSTSLELIHVSDLVVNTDSCTVKEAVMLNTPVVNIRSKDYKVLEDLYCDDAKERFLWNFNSCEKILNHMEKNCEL